MKFDPNWSIRPLAGLGPLTFGMGADEVASHDSIYGRSTKTICEEISVATTLKVLAPFADTVPGIRENMAAMKRQAEDAFSEYRQNNNLILTYRKHLLAEIVVGPHCQALNFAETALFGEAPELVVKRLTQINGNARFLAPSILFDTLGLFLNEFASRDQANRLTFRELTDEVQDDRVVIISSQDEIDAHQSAYAPVQH